MRVEGKMTLTTGRFNLDCMESSSPRRDEMGAKIHVLTLAPFFPSAENEVSGCFIKEPIDRLANHGVVSSVLAVSPIYRPRKRPAQSAPADWVRFPQVPGNVGLAWSGWFLYARLLRRVARLHREKPIDLIHAHAALPCGHAAALLQRRLGIPYVVTVHGLDVFNSRFGDRVSAQWRRQRSIEVYQTAGTVVCISGRVQEILRSGVPDGVRSEVVYNGTDVDMFSPASPERDPSKQELLVVGNLIPSKGQELVLRAIARLTSSLPQLRCRFIGDGPDRGRLQALSRQLGIDQQIQFLGCRSRKEVADAMRDCSVFVLPSRSEGLGCVYLEAMACGKPVVACHGQGIDEIIDHRRNGWLIPGDGLEQLMQALSMLLQSPDLRSHMGLAARETILSGLTLSHQAQALIEIYRDAVARR